MSLTKSRTLTSDVVLAAVRSATQTRQSRRQLDLASLDGEDLWQWIRQSEMYAREMRSEYVSMKDVLIWRLPEFFLDNDGIDRFFSIVKKHKALILDLRGNPGGAQTTLLALLGGLFPKDVAVADVRSRKPQKPLVAKGSGDRAYTGEVVVLVDSESGSAAEIFARVMQIEGRGTVIGDRSAGSVMQSLGYGAQQGLDTVIWYYFSVTSADLVMKDGKSLEHTGVVPNDVVIPSGEDLAAGRDPALSRAAMMFGQSLAPEAAGQLFPYRWRPF